MLPKEVTKFIGQVQDVTTLEVEIGAIRRFADAVGDTNPLYWDEEYARKSKYGSIIAPPGFFGWPVKPVKGALTFPPVSEELNLALAGAGYPKLLDGGIEFDFLKPIKAGDTLVSTQVVKDIIEREGKAGKLVFVITEYTYVNRNGDVVAKARRTSIYL